MTTRTRPKTSILIGVALAAVVAVAAIALASGGGSGSSGTTVAAVPDLETGDGPVTGLGPKAPQDEFAFFDGTSGTLAAYEGRPTVINFWASWCPSCVAEMSAAFLPAQLSLGDQVSFVGFNIQDERSKALELVDETGVLFDLAEDPQGDLFTELGGLGMPFTVFISEAGEIIHKHNGPLTEGQLVDLINEKLLEA